MADLTALERAELHATVAAMTDDAYKVEVLAQLRKINGTVANHNDDLYGVPTRQIRGIKPTVELHEQAIVKAQTSFRTVMALVGLFGTGNLVGLLVLWSRAS